jgi:hypothetical protein
MTAAGPFDTERPAAAASLYARQGRPHDITAVNLAELTATLANIELGAFDRHVTGWLAGFEPATVAVICGLISRARQPGPVLDRDQLRMVLAALDEAADHKRDLAASCPTVKRPPPSCAARVTGGSAWPTSTTSWPGSCEEASDDREACRPAGAGRADRPVGQADQGTTGTGVA